MERAGIRLRRFWLALGGSAILWVWFVSSLHPQEMILGVVCTVASVLFLTFAWPVDGSQISLAPRDVLQIWRVPAQVLGDALRVTWILLRDLVGAERAGSALVVHGFSVQPASSESRGRQVLAVAYLTASPNSIVLGVHQQRQLMMVHQLAVTPLPQLARELGAKEQE